MFKLPGAGSYSVIATVREKVKETVFFAEHRPAPALPAR